MNGVPETPEAEVPSPVGVHRHPEHDFVELWIAPGPRQSELERVLAALHPGRCRAAADLYEVPGSHTTTLSGAHTTTLSSAGAPTLLLDGDHLSLEDIGWIRRMVATGAIARVVAVGTDPGAAAARALRSLPSLLWTPWPPDLNEIKSWLPPAVPHQEAALERPVNARATPDSAASSSPASSSPSGAASGSASGPALGPAATRPSALSTAGALGLGRDQVAVLADISQRLELAFLALRESGRADEGDLEAPQIELRRLLRFTRSLACLAAPPPRGVDEFDVVGLIEELLATLTLRGRRGPRFQPSSGPGGRPAVEFMVRADRAALAMAFESVLALARLCSSGGDTVRVSYTPIEGSAVAIAVEFAAGPLQGLDPRRLLDSALLRERLPELGPSELAAANAILVSQGGSMELKALAEGQLAVRMRIPVERSPVIVAAPPPAPASVPAAPASVPAAPAHVGRGPRGRSDDPFA